MAAEGKTIYNLTAGELASETPDYIKDYVADKLSLNKYTPVAGLPDLRAGIAANVNAFYGLDWVRPENVIVTAGAKPALYAALLSIINPGDEVIMPTPAWVSYYHLIELAGGKVVEVPLGENYDLDVLAIAHSITDKTKAIILNSPHNPTGAVFSRDSLEQLAARLRGSNVFVISDDIYVKLVYTENISLPADCGFENLIIINGFSKSQALTGWRIGYAVAGEGIVSAMTSLLSHIMGNASLPAQEAGLAALTRHDQPPEETIEALKRQRGIVKNALDNIPTLSYHLPDGAFYFFLDLRRLTDNSSAWCEDLLTKTGVALVPGEAFSAPGFVRLTFVSDSATLEAALQKISEYLGAQI